MKAKFRRILAWMLVFMLMSADVCAIAATLELPKALTIIDEGALYGATSIDEVVVPDNVTEINLPESIEYIADDTLDNCENIEITAKEGSYA